MREFFGATDPYVYPGISVLQNKLGLREQGALDHAERLFVSARLLSATSVPQTFDYAHFRALHFHMFQDVYDWAGQERTVLISKGHSPFAQPVHISHNSIRILSEFRAAVQSNRHRFSVLPKVLGHFVSEMNAVHPFREGNGRHLRAFLLQAVEQLGCGYDASVMARKRWIHAAIVGFEGNEGPIAELLSEMLTTPATNREGFFAQTSLPRETRTRLCAFLKRCGYPADIVREYRTTLRC